MNDQVKNALESAMLAALAFAVCLWLVVSSEESDSAVRAIFGGLGVAVSIIAHVAYVGVALHRAGRSVWPWVAVMALVPGASVVAMVLLSSGLPDKNPAGQGREPPQAG